MRLGATTQAREDLSRALALTPPGESKDELEAALAKLGEKTTPSN